MGHVGLGPVDPDVVVAAFLLDELDDVFNLALDLYANCCRSFTFFWCNGYCNSGTAIEHRLSEKKISFLTHLFAIVFFKHYSVLITIYLEKLFFYCGMWDLIVDMSKKYYKKNGEKQFVNCTK